METKTPFIVSTAPHIKAEQDVNYIMKMVCMALVPAFAVSLYSFGWYAIFITAVCVAACVLTEAACLRLRHKPITIHDYSAVVTGLLLAAVIPPNVSWYVAAVGGIFAIAVAKQCFGGLGNNIWNPALLARAFLQVAYASQMNSGAWAYISGEKSIGQRLGYTLAGGFDELAKVAGKTPDVISSATALAKIAKPVSDIKDGFVIAQSSSDVWRTFIGLEGGCIAEVSALALLLGGLFLLFKKIITWEIPLCYIGVVALLGWALPAPYQFEGETFYTAWFSGPWLIHLFGGGLMIGAFFMATDMVTTPMSKTGRIIFGVGCGLLTIVIRIYSTSYPEGVCYSILIMNTCVPLIDAWTKPVKFGVVKKQG